MDKQLNKGNVPHLKSSVLIVLLCVFAALTGMAQQQSKKQKICFEKIIFHTTACYGSCPVYHMEVNAKKQIKLNVAEVFVKDKDLVFVPDPKKIGFFTGAVDQKRFLKLDEALRNIGLEEIKFNGANCCDASIITIIVYYEGKKKILKSMFPPQEAQKLISILYEICEKSNLIKSKDKFLIEDEGSDR